MNLKYLLILFTIINAVQGCQRTEKSKEVNSDDLKDPMIEVNRSYVEQESDRIDAYINRRGWEMQRTGTGLRYMIYHREDSTAEKAKEGQVAKINFAVSLISGDRVYSSDSIGPQEFKIGMADVETGLHEGIQNMRVGDKARFILPAHLAHGVFGDRQKIPSRTPIIYDVELLELK